MLIVALAWIYVAGMAALAEALSPGGTVLGALFTFLLYGALPLGIVLYVMATPARKKALRRAEAAETQAVLRQPPAEAAAQESAFDPDRRGHAPAGAAAAAIAPKREEA
jgi:hypothetical protein